VVSTTGSALLEDTGDDGPDAARELCEQALASGRLHLITQISSGVPDFVVDTFGERGPRVAPEDLDALRASCHSAARLIATFTDAQDGRLEDVRTGRLIRVVLHADGGAVYCYAVVPGQNVVGFVFDDAAAHANHPLARQPAVNAADHAMTELVDRLRGLLGLPAQNAGGWSSEGHEAQLAGDSAAELMESAVDTHDLHYVARLRTGQEPRVCEKLGDAAMRPYFRLITPANRRKFYDEEAIEIRQTVGQVGRLVRSTVGGTVHRLVLDVEQGAIYYYRLAVGDNLVGVTLNQEQVGATDGKLAALALRLQAAPDV